MKISKPMFYQGEWWVDLFDDEGFEHSERFDTETEAWMYYDTQKSHIDILNNREEDEG